MALDIAWYARNIGSKIRGVDVLSLTKKELLIS
jgi:hypothetical protein